MYLYFRLTGHVLHVLCKCDNNDREAVPNKVKDHWFIDERYRNRANKHCIVSDVLRRARTSTQMDCMR